MKKCPKCGSWTLDFDSYFGRFRCFTSECGWMAPSSSEMQIGRMRSPGQPIVLAEKNIPELGLSITALYDSASDAIIFDLGLGDATFDFPEPDGCMIWRICHNTGSVVGFVISGAKELGIEEILIDITARKQEIESTLRDFGGIAAGRPTKALVEIVAVKARTARQPSSEKQNAMTAAYYDAIAKFRERFLPHTPSPAGGIR